MSTSATSASKVSERLEWLEGKTVCVRFAPDSAGALTGETFIATYVDTLPMGREYFFVFDTPEGKRLIRTSSVVELAERGPSSPTRRDRVIE